MARTGERRYGEKKSSHQSGLAVSGGVVSSIKDKMTLKKWLWEGFYSLGHSMKTQ